MTIGLVAKLKFNEMILRRGTSCELTSKISGEDGDGSCKDSAKDRLLT